MLTCQQSVFKRYHSDKHFSQFLPTKWRQKSTGIDMEQHYVTVSIRGNTAVPITAQLSLERVPHTVLSGAISRPPDWRHQPGRLCNIYAHFVVIVFRGDTKLPQSIYTPSTRWAEINAVVMRISTKSTNTSHHDNRIDLPYTLICMPYSSRPNACK